MTATVVLVDSSAREPGPPPPSPWIGVGIGLAFLVLVSILAMHHARRRQRARPRRRTRLLFASVAGGAALMAMLIPGYVHEARGLGSLPGLGGFGLMLAVHLLVFALLAAPLVGTADLLLDYFQPRRTRAWLAFGPVAIAGFVVGLLLATGWVRPVPTAPEGGPVVLLLAALAGGLGWWAFLPAPGADAARVFE